MVIKNNYNMFIMFFLCLLGSFIVNLILYFALNLHFILSLLLFVILSLFFTHITNKGTIRKIIIDDKISIFLNNEIVLNYSEIESIIMECDYPRRLNSSHYDREITILINVKDGNIYHFPYANYNKNFYVIVRSILDKNPNIKVSNIFNLINNESEFNYILSEIKKCKVDIANYI